MNGASMSGAGISGGPTADTAQRAVQLLDLLQDAQHAQNAGIIAHAIVLAFAGILAANAVFRRETTTTRTLWARAGRFAAPMLAAMVLAVGTGVGVRAALAPQVPANACDTVARTLADAEAADARNVTRLLGLCDARAVARTLLLAPGGAKTPPTLHP